MDKTPDCSILGNTMIMMSLAIITSSTSVAPLCPPWRFQCQSSDCIHQDLVCDGRNDCLDGSDESPTWAGCEENTNVTEGAIAIAIGFGALVFLSILSLYCFSRKKPELESSQNAPNRYSNGSIFHLGYSNDGFEHEYRGPVLETPPSYDSIFGQQTDERRDLDNPIDAVSRHPDNHSFHHLALLASFRIQDGSQDLYPMQEHQIQTASEASIPPSNDFQILIPGNNDFQNDLAVNTETSNNTTVSDNSNLSDHGHCSVHRSFSISPQSSRSRSFEDSGIVDISSSVDMREIGVVPSVNLGTCENCRNYEVVVTPGGEHMDLYCDVCCSTHM